MLMPPADLGFMLPGVRMGVLSKMAVPRGLWRTPQPERRAMRGYAEKRSEEKKKKKKKTIGKTGGKMGENEEEKIKKIEKEKKGGKKRGKRNKSREEKATGEQEPE